MKSTMRLFEVWMAVGALSIVVLLVQGSNAYRLQQQKLTRDGSSSKGVGLTSLNVEKSKSLVGGGSSSSTGTGIISSGGISKKGGGSGGPGGGGGGEVSVWPPRLPMWGFLPQSSSSHSSIHQQIKSKSESSKEDGEEEDNSHTHHHSSSSSTFLDEDDEPWLSHLKRSSGGGGGVKRTRNYDVPQIECPPADDGMERFACPTPDNLGRYRCVDDHVLCDGFVDCPGREDEDRQACMFYKTTKAHLDVLADALLRWARGKR